MCAPGFVPAGRMRANCTSDGVTVDGTWTPDPATLMCNGEITEQHHVNVHILKAGNAMIPIIIIFWYNYTQYTWCRIMDTVLGSI